MIKIIVKGAVFLCLFLTGSKWTFNEKDVSIKLYPDTPEGRAARAAEELARAEARAKEQVQREKQPYPR